MDQEVGPYNVNIDEILTRYGRAREEEGNIALLLSYSAGAEPALMFPLL
jgi:hypothetical protein